MSEIEKIRDLQLNYYRLKFAAMKKSIPLGLIVALILVPILVVFVVLNPPAKKEPAPPVKQTSQAENRARANEIKSYLAEGFGTPPIKASWYDDISGITVDGQTVFVQTKLSQTNAKAENICSGVSSFVFSNEGRKQQLDSVQVLSQSGNSLIYRKGINNKCS